LGRFLTWPIDSDRFPLDPLGVIGPKSDGLNAEWSFVSIPFNPQIVRVMFDPGKSQFHPTGEAQRNSQHNDSTRIGPAIVVRDSCLLFENHLPLCLEGHL
jgi:hypothetical protein